MRFTLTPKPPQISKFVNDFIMGMKAGGQYPKAPELVARQIDYIQNHLDLVPYVSKNPIFDRLEIERYLTTHALVKTSIQDQRPNPEAIEDLTQAIIDSNKALSCLSLLVLDPKGYEKMVKETCKDPRTDFYGIHPMDDCRKFLNKQIELLANIAPFDPVAAMRRNNLIDCNALYIEAQQKTGLQGYDIFRPQTASKPSISMKAS